MMRVRANAKINLFLHVRGTRSDGYHEIESIFHSVDLADSLTIEAADDGRIETEISYATGAPGAPVDQRDNTVVTAARALQAHTGSRRGARIAVRKEIPAGAGLGGGSADAAATLVALNNLWDLHLSVAELRGVAEEVGSDVPFCIEGGPALVTGRGEHVARLTAESEMWLVLGLSHRPLLTAEVYARWDAGRTDTATSASMVMALGAGDLEEVAASLHNDLETAAFSLRPELEHRKEAMAEAGVLGLLMSGSGPTIFGLVEGPTHAAEVAGRLQNTFERVAVARTRPSCVETEDA